MIKVKPILAGEKFILDDDSVVTPIKVLTEDGNTNECGYLVLTEEGEEKSIWDKEVYKSILPNVRKIIITQHIKPISKEKIKQLKKCGVPLYSAAKFEKNTNPNKKDINYILRHKMGYGDFTDHLYINNREDFNIIRYIESLSDIDKKEFMFKVIEIPFDVEYSIKMDNGHNCNYHEIVIEKHRTWQ